MKEEITKKIIAAALYKFSLQHGRAVHDMRIAITTDRDDFATPIFQTLCKKPDGQTITLNNVEFSDIYDGDMSIFSFFEKGGLGLLKKPLEILVPEHLSSGLRKVAAENTVEPSKVKLIIVPSDDQVSKLAILLFIGGTFKEQISLEKLLN